ncbi:hypothetical protein D5272_05030 [bacterium D16-76]|nr:hypothetical protein [bacterium D16-76]
MASFILVLLCSAGLFAALMLDRFRFWTTLAVGGAASLLALLAGVLLHRMVDDPALANLLSCWVGAVLLFGASLVIHSNNILQKLFVLLLCPACLLYAEVFLPQLLGLLPIHTAGVAGGVLSALFTVLLYLLMGLCLYRPFHHFSDRSPSAFLAGMCVLLALVYLICWGKMDFLFSADPLAGRLLFASLLFLLMVFCFRSVYQAGRFRAGAAEVANRQSCLNRGSADFGDLFAAVQEVHAAHKKGEYALDTVSVMLQDGVPEQVPAYIYMAKHVAAQTPVLRQYHENPYLNGVIAAKAAFAAQNGIDFQCNAVTGNVPLKTSELCMLFHEMLGHACREAMAYTGEEPRHVRFTAIPGEDSLRLEAVYAANPPPPPPSFTLSGLSGQKLSGVLHWLFEDRPEEEGDFSGLENTAETVMLHSGRLSLSNTPEEAILLAEMRF